MMNYQLVIKRTEVTMHDVRFILEMEKYNEICFRLIYNQISLRVIRRTQEIKV